MPQKEKNPGEHAAFLAEELKHREAELAILGSVQQGLASHLEVNAIYELVGDKICEVFDPEVVIISTYDNRSNTVEHRYAIEHGERVYFPGQHPPGGFRGQIIKTLQPLLENTNVAEKAAALGQPTLPGTVTPKSWLGVPMLVDDQVTGVLSLQSIDHENAFRESDVKILETLAASMSVALENARLWEQEHLYRQSLEREFEMGRRIQAGFLPDKLPQPRGWEVAASLQPAREVAGDFYDVFRVSSGKLGLVIADVCDKGLGAALFMTLVRSLLRAAANIDFYTRVKPVFGRSTETQLREAVLLTNNYLEENHGSTGMFATLFFGILNTRSGVLQYINCGHIPPVVRGRDGSEKYLLRTGPALGAIPDPVYMVESIRLERGGMFFACTDGVTDAENATGESFTLERAMLLVREASSPSRCVQSLSNSIADFCGEMKLYDDITMLALKRAE